MPRYVLALCALALVAYSTLDPAPAALGQEVHTVVCDLVSDGADLNAAIAAAAPGDMIELLPGELAGCLLETPVVVTKSLTLQGLPGGYTPILGPAVGTLGGVASAMERAEGNASTPLADLVSPLAAKSPSGPLLRVAAGPTTITGLRITGGYNAEPGGGIAVDSGVQVFLFGNEIIANAAPNGGGIALLGDNDDSIVAGNRISQNVAADLRAGAGLVGDGGGLWIGPGVDRLQVGVNQVMQNLAAGAGGGLHVGCGAESLVLEGNRVERNRAGRMGGGIALGSNALPCGNSATTVSRNVIRRNVAVLGGGLSIEYDNPGLRVVNNALAGNAAEIAGGLRLDTTSGPTDNAIFQNTVAFNTAGLAGGYYQAAGTEVVSFNNVFWGNANGDLGDNGGACPTPRLSVVGTLLSESGQGCAARGPDAVGGDPALASASDLDLHLQARSAAIGLGTLDFGGLLAPLLDIEGVVRGAQPDAGAYEFLALPPPATPPSVPSQVFSGPTGAEPLAGPEGSPTATLATASATVVPEGGAAANATVTVGTSESGGSAATPTARPSATVRVPGTVISIPTIRIPTVVGVPAPPPGQGPRRAPTAGP